MEVTHPEGILEVPGSSAVLDVFRAEGRKSWGGPDFLKLVPLPAALGLGWKDCILPGGPSGAEKTQTVPTSFCFTVHLLCDLGLFSSSLVVYNNHPALTVHPYR